MRLLLALLALLLAAPASAQTFPPLTGRVVDQADLMTPAQEGELDRKLEALQRASSRQLVVATVSSLGGLPIEDYGYQLGRRWGIGQRGANNGIILLIAPTEHKVRIEVGYGLEGIVTDALSSQIIRGTITPRFKAGDMAGGIIAGADALIAQLAAPPEAAERAAVAAQQAENRHQERRRDNDGSILPLIFWGAVLLFIVLPAFGAGFAGRRYRGRGRRGVSIWGPGYYGRRDGSGLGWFLAGIALDSIARGGRGGGRGGGGGSWGGGGGGSWGGGGGGGFSGGGGSFGGGGASGGW